MVEDDVRQSSALKRGLEAEGFAVDVAATGPDGLWMGSEEPFDVIILDVMLPGMNGFAVCRSLRAKKIWTPILMLTAKDGELDETEALDTGADDFLTKPFSYLVLVSRIRALLRRGATSRPVVLVAGRIQLDVHARRCLVDGEVVELTPREFSVVEYLMQHVNEVVPKADILAHTWDFAFEGGANVVEVHVSALRRKLGPSHIETVRGAGYRMSSRAR